MMHWTGLQIQIDHMGMRRHRRGAIEVRKTFLVFYGGRISLYSLFSDNPQDGFARLGYSISHAHIRFVQDRPMALLALG